MPPANWSRLYYSLSGFRLRLDRDGRTTLFSNWKRFQTSFIQTKVYRDLINIGKHPNLFIIIIIITVMLLTTICNIEFFLSRIFFYNFGKILKSKIWFFSLKTIVFTKQIISTNYASDNLHCANVKKLLASEAWTHVFLRHIRIIQYLFKKTA